MKKFFNMWRQGFDRLQEKMDAFVERSFKNEIIFSLTMPFVCTIVIGGGSVYTIVAILLAVDVLL